MELGMSVYLSSGYERNIQYLERGLKAGIKGVFTSLQIPEENFEQMREDFFRLLAWCQEKQLCICADVSPGTLQRLKLSKPADLYQMGIGCIRLDDGFSDEEIIALSQEHRILINASVVSERQMLYFKSYGMQFANVMACHNYYPKPHTGLSKQFYKSQNALLHSFGVQVITFIPGDGERRGPLYEGLPTLEFCREKPLAFNAGWIFLQSGDGDALYIGDPSFSEAAEPYLKAIGSGYLRLPTVFCGERFAKLLRGRMLHVRPDRGEETLRIMESRTDAAFWLNPGTEGCHELKRGNLVVSNTAYQRYCNELEIVLCDLPEDPRYNVIGRILPDYLPLLDFIGAETKFKLMD